MVRPGRAARQVNALRLGLYRPVRIPHARPSETTAPMRRTTRR